MDEEASAGEDGTHGAAGAGVDTDIDSDLTFVLRPSALLPVSSWVVGLLCNVPRMEWKGLAMKEMYDYDGRYCEHMSEFLMARDEEMERRARENGTAWSIHLRVLYFLDPQASRYPVREVFQMKSMFTCISSRIRSMALLSCQMVPCIKVECDALVEGGGGASNISFGSPSLQDLHEQ